MLRDTRSSDKMYGGHMIHTMITWHIRLNNAAIYKGNMTTYRQRNIIHKNLLIQYTNWVYVDDMTHHTKNNKIIYILWSWYTLKMIAWFSIPLTTTSYKC